jgi:hypothetical protein
VILAASNCTGECLKSGPWGLAIVLLLGVACYFLFKSMSKRIKRVKDAQTQPPAPKRPDSATVARAEIVTPPKDDEPEA